MDRNPSYHRMDIRLTQLWISVQRNQLEHLLTFEPFEEKKHSMLHLQKKQLIFVMDSFRQASKVLKFFCWCYEWSAQETHSIVICSSFISIRCVWRQEGVWTLTCLVTYCLLMLSKHSPLSIFKLKVAYPCNFLVTTAERLQQIYFYYTRKFLQFIHVLICFVFFLPLDKLAAD